MLKSLTYMSSASAHTQLGSIPAALLPASSGPAGTPLCAQVSESERGVGGSAQGRGCGLNLATVWGRVSCCFLPSYAAAALVAWSQTVAQAKG